MKISKVKHVKMGVSEKPIASGGMLYNHPAKESEFNLSEHVRRLNDKSKGLYNILTTLGDKKDPIERDYKAVSIFLTENIKKKLNLPAEEIAKGVTDRLRETGGNSRNAKEIAHRTLRNSLRKNISVDGKKVYAPDVFGVLFEGILGGKSAIAGRLDINELTAVLQLVKKDYEKSEQLKMIVNSIENQNVPVQIAEDGKRLTLSSAYNKKKSYIFEYLIRYAAASDEEKKDMIKHMRYLIALYFYGKDIADGFVDGFNDKTFGLLFRENEGYMVEDIVAKLTELDALTKKGDKRALEDELANKVSESIVAHYQEATSASGISDEDKKWLCYISDHTGRTLEKTKPEARRYAYDTLCKNTFDEWLSFISLKFIDLGKGVYHFAMENQDEAASGETVSMGEVAEKYKNGISSFDYEMVKAEDSLSRSLSQFVSFALNNFDASVRNQESRDIDGEEDILSAKKLVLRDDAVNRMLRFYGGASSFDASFDGEAVVTEMVEYFKVTRNTSFHFVKAENSLAVGNFAKAVLNKEKEEAGQVFRKKYFSNNVPRFYKEADINALMDRLYSERKVLVAQVPSFNKVLSINEMKKFYNEWIPNDARAAIKDAQAREILRHSLYFVLKEIYYYDFLKKDNLTERFIKAVDELPVKNERTDADARKDFKERVSMLKKAGLNFGEICQEIMTEYNQQNNQFKKAPSAVKMTGKNPGIKEVKNTEIYKHFRTLLQLGIRGAFKNYLKETDAYKFLETPSDMEEAFGQIDEDTFVKSYRCTMYSELDVANTSDPAIMSWYMTAHFLNQKQLNHLIGQVKTYIQFINDIESRAKSTGNKTDAAVKKKTDKYAELLNVLELTKLFCAAVSNKLEDYFEDADAYAKYIANYVDFEGDNAMLLQAFCNETVEGDRIGRFYDGTNPIVNRNIVLASMYGNEKILSQVMDRVTEKEFGQFYAEKQRLEKVFKTGRCETADDVKKYREFQNLKNRIELVDVLVLSELTNDVLSQFIGYAYLRERDLMYMQLGYHYIKLFYTDTIPKDSYLRCMEGEGNFTDGALLYQIAAMYSFSLPVFKINADGKSVAEKKATSIGSSVGTFIKVHGAGTYTEGLCFFEDIDDRNERRDRHDQYVSIRKNIEHFKYYGKLEDSLLDIYGWIYSGFFSYNTKLRKNLAVAIRNLLLSYFVNTKLKYEKDERNLNIHGKLVSLPCTKICMTGTVTDYLTYGYDGKAVSTGKDAKQVAQKSALTADGGFDISALMSNLNGGGFKNKPSKPEKKKEPDKNASAGTCFVAARSDEFINQVCKLMSYRKDGK